MNTNLACVTLVGVCLVGALASAAGQSARSLVVLTVPASQLPTGCALKPAEPDPPSVGSPSLVARPSWVPAQPPVNPWSGSDRSLAASIRARIDATPRVPDGPPVDAAGIRAWQLKWADNVVDAYHATYLASGASPIEVLAVRFNDAALAREGPVPGTRPPPRGMVTRVVLGPMVALVLSPVNSDCFKAVSRHIQALR